MKIIKFLPAFLSLSVFLSISCKQTKQADAVYYNAKVYTVDSAFSVVSAFAVRDGRIIDTGSSDDMLNYNAPQKIDLKGQCVYPGLIDAHCHFYGYAIDLGKIWLIGTTSFQDCLDTLARHKDQRFMGWVFGRGWDQNDWKVEEFPDCAVLDSMFPDVPVFLMRIDGHAALVNSVAMKMAGITAKTKVLGGEVIQKNGKATGVLIDNAVDLVKAKIPVPDLAYTQKMLRKAQENCFAVGLTTVDDAGLDYRTILQLDSFQKAGDIRMRIYAMAMMNKDNVAYYRKHGAYKTDFMNVRSFKVYGDGALGSRGACLKQEYADEKGHFGFLLHPVDSFRFYAETANETGFQLNIHAIGDSANAFLLKTYASVLKGKNNKRWRIEHAQIVDAEDVALFGNYSIIPSVQPTHATSDMYWAKDRIGTDRMKYAYAYRTLMLQNGMVANGSDFPVEDINPLYGFFAAVTRQDRKDFPAGGFQKENALSREEAMRGMTTWAAYANFEEGEKGTIEKGKLADFVITSGDLMKAKESNLKNIRVTSTYVGGQKVY